MLFENECDMVGRATKLKHTQAESILRQKAYSGRKHTQAESILRNEHYSVFSSIDHDHHFLICAFLLHDRSGRGSAVS
jgi:hypothetical protein